MEPSEAVLFAAHAFTICLLLLIPITPTKELARSALHHHREAAECHEDTNTCATNGPRRRSLGRTQQSITYLSSAIGLIVTIRQIEILGRLKGATIPSQWHTAGAWFQFAIWNIALLQAAGHSAQVTHSRSFGYGLYDALVGLVLITSSFLSMSSPCAWLGSAALQTLKVDTCTIQLAMAVISTVSYLWLPLHPDVLVHGDIVDQQFSVSLVERYSFSWINPMFNKARQSQLYLSDLPQMDDQTRSRNVNDRFSASDIKGRLWARLICAHLHVLAQQWTLAFLKSILGFTSQILMLYFLQHLDTEYTYIGVDKEAWFLVLGFGLSLSLEIAVDGWLEWVTASRLVIPVQALLSSLIFQKATRQKDVHGTRTRTQNQKREHKENDRKEVKPVVSSLSHQSVVNHIKLDSGRVTMFCQNNYKFPLAISKIAFAGILLVRLLGWQSLLSGAAASILLIPLSKRISKTYGTIHFGLVKFRDARVSLLMEALRGIRQIKFSGVEQIWEEKIMRSRSEELKQLWKGGIAMSCLVFIVNLTPIILAAVSLSVFSLQDDRLTPAVAFTSLGLFEQMQTALGLLPLSGTYIWEAWTSCSRIERYLDNPEQQAVASQADSIRFENATVMYPIGHDANASSRTRLDNVSLVFPKGRLSVISGKTGSGKSLLLASILGEANLLSGNISLPMKYPSSGEQDISPLRDWIDPVSVAFVSQPPWLENCSLKDNILFGLPFDQVRYEKTISACALERDIELLAEGSNTEVGMRGVSLSGGQQWRLALARALYSRAGILLLDDIFSALDSRTGRWVFDKALCGDLTSGRTLILVTHNVELCRTKMNYLVHVRDGTTTAWEYSDVHMSPQVCNNENTTKNYTKKEQDPPDVTTPETLQNENMRHPDKNPARTKEERPQVRRSKWSVYGSYFHASGGLRFWSISVIVAAAYQLLSSSQSWWLRKWTQDHSSLSRFAQAPASESTVEAVSGKLSASSYYAFIYMILSLSSVLAVAMKCLLLYVGGIKASDRLYRQMTRSVLRSPLLWIDTTPVGQILNRFTSDVQTLDATLVHNVGYLIECILKLGIITLTSMLSSWYLAVCGSMLIYTHFVIARQYLYGAREIKRISSLSNSPIYDQLESILEGLATVRAFKRHPFYVERMFDLIDNSSKANWYLSLSSRWLEFRTGILGVALAAAMAAVAIASGFDASFTGFALTIALQYSTAMSGLVRKVTDIDIGFISADRILDYAHLLTEQTDGVAPPDSWPIEGRLAVHGLVAAHSKELPAVLRGISFSVSPKERFGVVGRTGAGKSTLTYALLRLINIRKGSVRIDNIDTSTLRLEDLRRRLVVIPQDPVLFSGTLRTNLEVNGVKNDSELMGALKRVAYALSESSSPDSDQPTLDSGPATGASRKLGSDIFEDLYTPVSNGGSNLSQGQRQLVCLVRAILDTPKIILMDEATSAVDLTTDTIIQQVIRTDLSQSTIIVIAHRLSTIADFDRILVLSDGAVEELGSPANLLRNKGLFWEMVCQSSEREFLESKIMGKMGDH